MTFEDMMAMKRLGETAVSPDGKWLAYSVTTVDLEKNSKTPELWLQQISGGEPFKLAWPSPAMAARSSRRMGTPCSFSRAERAASRSGLADFDAATGATSNCEEADGDCDRSRQREVVAGRAVRWCSRRRCIRIARRSRSRTQSGDKCNADKDKAAADSKVKAQIWNELLYRHWNHFTGPQAQPSFSGPGCDAGKMRDLTPGDTHDVPPFSLGGGGGFSISPDSKELAFTENPDPVPAISTSAQILTLDLTNPAAKPVKISTSAGGNFDPAYSPDGKYIAWRSQARAGYESDKFRLALYDRAAHASTTT